MQKQYVMLVDTARCVNCKACEVACRAEWNTPLGESRNWVSEVMNVDADGQPRLTFLSGRCMHCERPECVEACPTGASYKRDDGLVLIDREICTGCEFCLEVCPFDARFRDPGDGRMSKCTFCQPRLDAGLQPACVDVCFTKALIFGDANDPESDVARQLEERVWKRLVTAKMNTGPSLYYSEETLFDETVLPVAKDPTVAAKTLSIVNPGIKAGLGGMVGLFGAAGFVKLVKRRQEVANHEK